MNYKIAYTNPAQQYIKIEVNFDCEKQNEIVLQFPAWRPGRYELGDFAQNIKNFTVVDKNGKKVPFKKISKDQWKVNSEAIDSITVAYFYYASELNAGSSFMDDVQLYVNPVNCMVYMEDRQLEPCTMTLDIPDDFEIATGAKTEGKTIYCANLHEMMDSPFIASANLQHKSYTVLGINFHIWLQGEVNVDWERILNDFERFTKIQIEKFSNKREKIVGFPVKEFHFLYQILSVKAYHGVEHKTGTVIALGPTTQLMEGLYDDFLGVSSHELYHVWNIKSIRQQEMYPYNYATQNYSELGYIAEGVTTYLGDLFLAESNVKSFAWYKSELEKLLQKHFDNFGRFNYSVAESSWDTWLDGYKLGAPFRKVSIYNEGALLAFAVDLKIRKESSNKASIHSVMNKLYEDFALKNKGYTEKDYIAACELFSGVDLTSFFADFVHGTQPFESILVEALETIGFTLEMERNPAHAERILGVKTIVTDGKVIVQSIFPGSSAELGALILKDEIVQVNGLAIDKNINDVVGFFQEYPLNLTVNRKGRILEIVCPNTNRAMYPIYKIKKVKIPSNFNKRIFKNWIGSTWDDCGI